MTPKHERPLSPHLTIWKWGPHMLVSILHRITGGALSVVGLALLTWWMLALAGDGGGYAGFAGVVDHIVVQLILIGLTWAFWQHLLSGIRHLFLDIGAGFELKTNRFFAVLTIPASLLLTALTWAFLKGIF